eukprot:725946-Amphidinium_carterae.1
MSMRAQTCSYLVVYFAAGSSFLVFSCLDHLRLLHTIQLCILSWTPGGVTLYCCNKYPNAAMPCKVVFSLALSQLSDVLFMVKAISDTNGRGIHQQLVACRECQEHLRSMLSKLPRSMLRLMLISMPMMSSELMRLNSSMSWRMPTRIHSCSMLEPTGGVRGGEMLQPTRTQLLDTGIDVDADWRCLSRLMSEMLNPSEHSCSMLEPTGGVRGG